MKHLPLSFDATPALYLMCVALVLLLTSCSNDNMTDLRQYVDQQRHATHGKIEPLPDPVSFDIYQYKKTGLRNPFVSEKTDVEGPVDKCPQVTRARTPLETLPLATLTLVGSLEQDGTRWALVKDQESIVHRLKQGDYLGQNNGRIISISETEVVLQEMVSDRVTGCQQRQSTLAIAGQ